MHALYGIAVIFGIFGSKTPIVVFVAALAGAVITHRSEVTFTKKRLRRAQDACSPYILCRR